MLVLVPDRRRRLLDHLQRAGSAQVEELSGALGVSTSTVRRDLADLEAEGLLRRAHGGAYLHAGSERPVRASVVNPQADEAKLRIGAAAAETLHDGMTIMILAGSTTSALLSHCAGRDLTVVTNGLDIAHTLSAFPDVEVVMLGGVLHREQMTLLGAMTEQNMADLHVDVLYAGAYGVDAHTGVTGAKVISAGYHHSMLKHTASLVVLADASKFGRKGPTLLAGIDQVDTFVTDRDADPGVVAAIRERGTAVTVC